MFHQMQIKFIARINRWVYSNFCDVVYSTPTESVEGGNIFLYKHLTPMGSF